MQLLKVNWNPQLVSQGLGMKTGVTEKQEALLRTQIGETNGRLPTFASFPPYFNLVLILRSIQRNLKCNNSKTTEIL